MRRSASDCISFTISRIKKREENEKAREVWVERGERASRNKTYEVGRRPLSSGLLNLFKTKVT